MKYLILTFFSLVIINAQSVTTDSSETNEKIYSKYEYNPLFPGIQIPENFSLKIDAKYLQFQNDPTDFFMLTMMADPKAQLDSATLRKIEFKELSKNLNSSMLMMYNIKHGKDPTLLRQILGTAMTAAAAGLAGYHVYKYYVKKEQ